MVGNEEGGHLGRIRKAYCSSKLWGVIPHPCFLHFGLAVCIAGVYEQSFGGGAY